MTNTLSALIISATWLTNSIERPPEDGPQGNVWYRTNIASLRTVTVVVGDGIYAQRHTNTVAMHTNATMMVRAAWNTNGPKLLESGKPLDTNQSAARKLPPAPKR